LDSSAGRSPLSLAKRAIMGEKSLFTDYSQVIHSLIRVTLAKLDNHARGFAQKIDRLKNAAFRHNCLSPALYFANFEQCEIYYSVSVWRWLCPRPASKSKSISAIFPKAQRPPTIFTPNWPAVDSPAIGKSSWIRCRRCLRRSRNAHPSTPAAVLAQTSKDQTDERFPILIYDGEIFQDFKLTTRFKIVGGMAEQMAGVVFRFQNASNFYVVRASALGHNVRFYKWWTASAPIRWDRNWTFPPANGTRSRAMPQGNQIISGLDENRSATARMTTPLPTARLVSGQSPTP
jgi:hypothetical protein